MNELSAQWTSLQTWLADYPQLELAAGLVLLLVVAAIGNFVIKRLIIRLLVTFIQALAQEQDRNLLKRRVVSRLANIIPALVFYFGIGLVPNMPDLLVTVVLNVTNAFIILTLVLAFDGAMTLVNQVYERRPDAARKPIKGYVQVIKIIAYAVGTILIIATLIDRSPLIFLSGLGAMAAVLMLVFQDTLLSLVASMQISSNDIIRVGDWVEMPQLNADGDVIDIALHTVKIQNWDRTITTIPTRRFITDSFRNWRGMQESGGRRMMRNLMLDQQSIRFLEADDLKRLKRFRLLHDYLEKKQAEIDDWNRRLEAAGEEPANTRRITNIGTFRAYVKNYLDSHEGVNHNMMTMVRQLSPTPDGLPLEVYAFTNTIAWSEYEGIQSDIFDHLYSIVSEFGLRIYQRPSGYDLKHIQFEPQSLQGPGRAE
ncbi:MAG: mechanosensitive ion channel [Idiomarina sp.]|nr:mechanosensitive ion channel [Idiomarina sp.]